MDISPAFSPERRRDGLHLLRTPEAVGLAAAAEAAACLRATLATKSRARIIMAAAPSQAAMLKALASAPAVDWRRVEAFHMDEYVGLPPDAPQRFSNWLRRAFFNSVELGEAHLLEPEPDAQIACRAYTALLAESEIDLVCCGIGMNGHLAFNDPPADFGEHRDVRVVALQEESRQQQVVEGLFLSLDSVPTHAVTLSVPRLLRARKLVCCVSGSIKSEAVACAFSGQVSPESPASALRSHPDCSVYLDEAAAAGLLAEGWL